MPNCYNMYGLRISSNQRTHQVKVCADRVFYRPVPGHYKNGANLIAVINGVETIVNGSGWIYWNIDDDTYGLEQLSNSECPGCISSVKKYDCINGLCQDSSIYGTQGVYASLSDCENNCSSNASNQCQAPNICVSPDYCPPNMVCLTLGELSTIDGLSSELKSKNCS